MKTVETMIIGLYLISLIGFGVALQRRATQSETSFYLADRMFGGVVNGLAMFTVIMSAAAFLGMSGLAYNLGVSVLWVDFVALFGLGIAFVFVVEAFRKSGLVTVPDFFGKRYGLTAQAAAAIIITLLFIPYIIAQLKAGALVASSVMGISYPLAVVLIGIVFTVYVTLGGMYAVTWTDFVQAIFMFFGMTIAVVAGFAVVGGWSGMMDMLKQSNNGWMVEIYSGGKFPWWMTFGFFLQFGLGAIAIPHALVRFYCVRDLKQARLSIGVAILAMGLFYMMVPFVGIFARLLLPALKDPDSAYILLVMKILPGWVAALGLAGVLAACMSTVDGMLLKAASSVSHDLYVKVIARDRQVPEKTKVRIAVVTMLVVGVISILGALKPPGLIAILIGLLFGVFAGAFVVPLLLGIWWKRANSLGGTAGIIGGFVVAVALTLLKGNLWFMPWKYWAGLVAIIVSFVLTVVISLATGEPTAEQQKFTTEIRPL